MEQAPTAVSQISDAFQTLKEPRVVLVALGGSVGTEVLYAAGFAMCVAAVGGSVTLGQAIFINVTVSAVLIYRLVSYYLPPLWGYASLRWLTKHDYV